MKIRICGTCAQEEGMDLEERINLSLTITPKQQYQCPSCQMYFVYDNGYSKSQEPFDIEEVIVEPIKEPVVTREEPPSSRVLQDQLTLF